MRENFHKHRLGDVWTNYFSGLITISLVSDNNYHGLIFKIILYNVIHLYALCLCLQNYGWWVFKGCPIPTKTPKQTLNHIMVC